jgi:hypothetical protein
MRLVITADGSVEVGESGREKNKAVGAVYR